MRHTLQRWLDSPRLTACAPLVTLAIGLFFVFVWAPHPWGWRGIDQYDALGRALARGEPFATTDVPWGYAYYLAFFHRIVGDHAWAPVAGQAVINAITPWLVFLLARPAVGQRLAALATWITAVFSFNTIYASTLSSDAICTVLFLFALLCFVRGHTRSSLVAFAGAGALAGIVPQFRPNLILLPVVVMGAYVFWPPRGIRRLAQCAVFAAAMTAMLMPWIVRNYHYTGLVLPTSTHGGIQLWYGTLQTGPYLESQSHNPRVNFASPAFPYTSLESSIVISSGYVCGVDAPARLRFNTSRDRTWRWIDGVIIAPGTFQYEIPAQPSPTTIHYYLQGGDVTTPPNGEAEPLIYFVNDDHLGDLDTEHELLDIFDIGRMARHLGAGEVLPDAGALDLDGDGRLANGDLARAIALLLPRWEEGRNPLEGLDMQGSEVGILLIDGSRLGVPSVVRRQSDFNISGELAHQEGAESLLAGVLVSRYRTMASLRDPRAACAATDGITVNGVFYRREPHLMKRYTALAFDNIRRDPMAFVAASAYRMVRLFIIRGTDDQLTTFQYPRSRWIFYVGTVASFTYFAAFLAGVVIAWRARSPFLYALIPIVYVPVTICFVLTNMRYTITVQPLMFVFVAMTVAALFRLGGPVREGSGA